MSVSGNNSQPTTPTQVKSLWPIIFGAIAIIFGLVTLFSGGSVLFGSELARTAAGDYVEWIVWFNFLAGFAYILAGAGLMGRKKWAVWLAIVIATATFIAAIGLGIHIWQGGAAETRTIGAMVLRFGVWAGIFIKTRQMSEFR